MTVGMLITITLLIVGMAYLIDYWSKNGNPITNSDEGPSGFIAGCTFILLIIIGIMGTVVLIGYTWNIPL